MEFKDFLHYFSPARVNWYLIAAGNRKARAARLYKANLKLGQAFHPLLGIFEVVLRNRINDVLTNHFANPNWIVNEKEGFMSDPSLHYTHKRTGKTVINDFLKREVEKAEKRLRKTITPITSGKIIAEQTLGFWTDLFEIHHYKLLAGKPIQIFSSLPSGYGRKQISDELNKIRRFRNRINHNEPLCFSGDVIDFASAEEVYISIVRLLSFINSILVNYLTDIDEVGKTIAQAKFI